MKAPVRSKVLNDPLLRRCHSHPDKPVKIDSLIQAGIDEYDEYGDDYCNDQVYSYKEKIKTKRQFD
jgi:hypothetical protein